MGSRVPPTPKALPVRRRPRAELTPMQQYRETVLLQKRPRVVKADIAAALGVPPRAISAVFLDRYRSIGNVEPRVIDYLNTIPGGPEGLTCAQFGWPQDEDEAERMHGLPPGAPLPPEEGWEPPATETAGADV